MMNEREPRARDLVGAVLDESYKLGRLLGEGGMGAVFEATQIRLNKRVAVKVMARELAANPEALMRFRREVQITSQLAHPHIVQVSDFGALPTGELYLVMEHLDGEDLDQRLLRVSRLPLATTVPIVTQVASALSATHAKGIVHRDLKPANVFLVQAHGVSDFVKVVDFGISKVKASSTKLTRASAMMGTPNYMAPEQAKGRVDDIDHRTDQWALACITWEMLSGREPFFGGDVPTVLNAIVKVEPPPLAARVRGLPNAVEAVLRRALSKRQGDRFATIEAFARALAAAATEPVLEIPTKSIRQTPLGVATQERGHLRSAARTLWTQAVKLMPERRKKESDGVVGRTMALGRRALDGLLPQRKKPPPRRHLRWLAAAGVGLAAAGGLFWYSERARLSAESARAAAPAVPSATAESFSHPTPKPMRATAATSVRRAPSGHLPARAQR